MTYISFFSLFSLIPPPLLSLFTDLLPLFLLLFLFLGVSCVLGLLHTGCSPLQAGVFYANQAGLKLQAILLLLPLVLGSQVCAIMLPPFIFQ